MSATGDGTAAAVVRINRMTRTIRRLLSESINPISSSSSSSSTLFIRHSSIDEQLEYDAVDLLAAAACGKKEYVSSEWEWDPVVAFASQMNSSIVDKKIAEKIKKCPNEEGQNMDLYIPRKCSATNRLITSKDHASVQINIGHLDERGIYTGNFSTFALCGFVRAQGDADGALDRLWQKKKVEVRQQERVEKDL
ncbi:hypothetical protein ACH5RR_031121 [Cinchona calisaya]|uniref:40S ribosomal protein S21 n=1 Tax=Cinchona calisaya TaxID=153742 RepID=A0ABD2YEA0_9GENT